MEWRALAETVPNTLLTLVDASVSKGINNIAEARVGLSHRINVLVGMTNGIVEIPQSMMGPVNPFERMSYASIEIAHHNALHNCAVCVFTIYGEHVDDLQPGLGRLWPAWVESRDLALRRAGELPWTLCSAMSFYLASMEAMIMAVRWLPGDSPTWSAWRLASEQLARRADLEASRALDEEQLMRNAAFLEYMDTSWILGSGN